MIEKDDVLLFLPCKGLPLIHIKGLKNLKDRPFWPTFCFKDKPRITVNKRDLLYYLLENYAERIRTLKRREELEIILPRKIVKGFYVRWKPAVKVVRLG